MDGPGLGLGELEGGVGADVRGGGAEAGRVGAGGGLPRAGGLVEGSICLPLTSLRDGALLGSGVKAVKPVMS